MSILLRNSRRGVALVACLIILFGAERAEAQQDLEQAPIRYQQTKPDNPVEELKERIESGKAEMTFDPRHGYLSSLLEELDISPTSQMLVFSKTSFQLRKISPHKPRAIYFNDDVYVGAVQNGDVLEISVADPKLGGVFYTIPQTPRKETARISRDQGECLSCHASSRTQNIPGHLVRSVFPNRLGQPLLSAGSYVTTPASPFSERWGGWYVTGTHGEMRHMGNQIATNEENPRELEQENGANVTSLSKYFDTTRYLTEESDLVALMVLEHQTDLHNRITFAQYEARRAAHYDGIMNRALDRPEDYQSDSTKRRIDAAVEKLVQGLLFCEEFQLEAPIEGTTKYADEFTARGPRDSRGRSLREFDLETRLFRYPCSYLIYSESFRELPTSVLTKVMARLHEILTAEEVPSEYAHLSVEDRQAIFKILQETLPELTVSWSDS